MHNKTEAQPVGNCFVELAHVNGAEAGLVGDLTCIRLHQRGTEIVFEIIVFRFIPESADRAPAVLVISIVNGNHVDLFH